MYSLIAKILSLKKRKINYKKEGNIIFSQSISLPPPPPSLSVCVFFKQNLARGFVTESNKFQKALSGRSAWSPV